MTVDGRRLYSPVIATATCGAAAVAIGMMVMAWGGAPRHFPVVNGVALLLGLIVAAGFALVPRLWRWGSLAAAIGLLATALYGIEIDGIRRWVPLGPVQIQPAFLFLPFILCLYARCPRDPLAALAVVVAAAGIALQPDRSMAVALAGVGLMILLALRDRMRAAVAVVALAALGAALMHADPLVPVPFVEDVLRHGWRAGPATAVALGIATLLLLLAPFVHIRRLEASRQRALVAFLLVWLMLLIASVIGPYPTPLLGYGASAVIGYCIAIVTLRATDQHDSASTLANPRFSGKMAL